MAIEVIYVEKWKTFHIDTCLAITFTFIATNGVNRIE